MGDDPPAEAPESLSAQVAALTQIVSQQQEEMTKWLHHRGSSSELFGGCMATGTRTSSPTSDANSQEFEEMLNRINPSSDDDPQSLEFAEALADLEECNEFGAEIQPHIANAFMKTIARPLSKETQDKVKKRLLIPNNCKLLVPPKINQEIWAKLPTKQRLADLNAQQVQSSIAVGISAFASLSDSIAKLTSTVPKEVVNAMLKVSMDAANILGNQFQSINMRRKQSVKPHLSTECAGICSLEIPPGEFLFGNNLSESLRTSKATAAVVRSSNLHKFRYKPYQQRYSSLNANSPFQQRGRWNGNTDQRRQMPRSSSNFHSHYPRQQFAAKPQFATKKF